MGMKKRYYEEKRARKEGALTFVHSARITSDASRYLSGVEKFTGRLAGNE
jgi:hypothetical protein